VPAAEHMRLGVISQWYDPEEGSAGVAGAICRSLVALGHEVHVLTGFPNYPHGRVYPGYRVRPYQYEHRAGVHVHRLPLVPNHDRSALRRAVNYLSFAASVSLRPDLLSSVQAWLVYSTPATVAVPAMLARGLLRRPYVLFIQDLWPDTVTESGFLGQGRMVRVVTPMLSRFCHASYRRATSIAVTSPGMAEILVSRGVPAPKLSVVHNWVDEQVFRPRPPRAARTGFEVMYAGNLGELQGLDTALEAAAGLTDLPDVRLVFVGTGVAEGRLRRAAARLGNVAFLGPQSLERTAALMSESDVQLVSLMDLPLFRATLPSKLQAALATGRPVIGAVAGDAAALIERSGSGLVTPPGDAEALAAAIRKVYAMSADARGALGLAGRQYYVDNLSRSVGSAILTGLLRTALNR
jgi:colanic acid biosynthesis glycosyl transferase WcaI